MPYIGYTFIILICVEVTLVVLGRVRPRLFPYLLYGTAAGMVLMTSLAGPYLVGFDIHLEYYFAQLHAGKDVMPPIVHIPQGTSIANNLIAPMLPIPLMWVYKLVYPLLFAVVPVILYFVYKKWLTPIQSFLASFLFIAFPAFAMELPTIARQMTAEVVLAILLYLLVTSNWRLRYKVPLIATCGALLPFFHYSIGLVAPILLGTSLVLASILKTGARKLIRVGFVTVVVASAIYLPLAEDGAVVKVVVHRYNSLVPGRYEIDYPLPPELRPPETRPAVHEDGEITPSGTALPNSVQPESQKSFIDRYQPLMRSGLGSDFLETTATGKVFRILQWAVVVLVVAGSWKLRRNRSYLVFASGGVLLLLLMLVPGFTGILNATRVVHLALFLVAPAFAVALKPKYLLIVLIPYFLFTSGFVFEVTKQDTIEQITIPYSIGLSDHRIDLGATTTADDNEIVRYIVDNELFPVFADIHGANLIGEVIGYRGDINRPLRQLGIWPAEGSYIFIRSRNVEERYLTLWNGTGCRRFVDPAKYGVDWNENVVYQSGDARVLEVK